MKKLLLFKNILLLVGSISVISIFSALYIEYIMEIKPCKLCLYQRMPYILAIFVSFFGYFFLKKKIFVYLILLLLISSLLLSSYHFGIEKNIFSEFAGCTTNNMNIVDKEELLLSFDKIMPNCKDVTFKLFGFSLATINIFISSFLIVILILSLKYENK